MEIGVNGNWHKQKAQKVCWHRFSVLICCQILSAMVMCQKVNSNKC